jgi:RimJ/RimL family protein N-acetyltransferase
VDLETERLLMSPLSGLHPWPQRDEVELGYVLARHALGRGIAAEAVRAWLDVAYGELGPRRLTAVIHPDNAASRALATRLGFRVHRGAWRRPVSR